GFGRLERGAGRVQARLRGAPATRGRPRAAGGWGAPFGPPQDAEQHRGAPRLRRGDPSVGGYGGPFEAPHYLKEAWMDFHGVDVRTQFKKMRELAPEVYRAFLEFDQKAFKDGAISAKTKELIALGIAHITQCPWCI